MLFTGPPSTGKTAIALGMVQTLGPDIPFTMIGVSEVSSLSMSKKEAFQRSMGIRIKEETELVEGEVVKFTRVSGATKTGNLTIKTADIKTIYGNRIDALSKEKALRHNH